MVQGIVCKEPEELQSVYTQEKYLWTSLFKEQYSSERSLELASSSSVSERNFRSANIFQAEGNIGSVTQVTHG